MKKTLFIFAILSICNIYAQTIPQFTQTPSTASMMGNSLVQMDDFRGKANINIPLFSMSLGDQEVPFSLYYNTGGVKVEDVGGNIGMNWNFTGESKIVRKQNGLPDDLKSYVFSKPTMPRHMALVYASLGWNVGDAFCLKLYEADNVGYMYAYNTIQSDLNNFSTNFGMVTQDYNLMPEAPHSNFPSSFANNMKYVEQSLDTAPDEFTVFLPDGTAFSFMYDHVSGKMKGINSDKFKITYIMGTLGINSFTITDPTGISYFFAETEEMYLRELTGELETNILPHTSFQTAENKPLNSLNICSGTSNALIDKYKNSKHSYAWHLTKISSYGTFQDDVINFEYDDVNILNIGFPRTYIQVNKGTKNIDVTKNYVYKSWINTKQLNKIHNKNTQVDFWYSDFRKDLISSGNFSTSRVLAGIAIYDKTRLIYPEVQINFNNNYVTSNESQISNVDNAVYKRLFLDGIDFYRNASPNGLFNKYTFKYNNAAGLPNKHSLAVDMFGYYMGGDGKRFPQLYYYPSFNNQSPMRGKFSPYTNLAVPNIITLTSMTNQNATDFEAKTPNSNYSYYGSLLSINDMYGKETKFSYENNNFLNYLGNAVLSGGIRIKKIEEKDTKTSESYSKNFVYNNGQYGYMENVPILAYETKNINTEALHISNRAFNYLDDFNTYYPKVKIVEGNGEYGHTVSSYTYYSDSNINNIILNYTPVANRFYRIYNTHNDISNYNIMLPSPVPHHFNFINTTQYPFLAKTSFAGINGMKTSEEIFDANNIIVKRIDTEYEIENTPVKILSTSSLHGGYELQYFFKINPKIVSEKDYAIKNGINSYLENKTILEFDTQQNLISDLKYDSKGNELKTLYTYPYNYPTTNIELNNLTVGNSISNFVTKKSLVNNEVSYIEQNNYNIFQRRAYLTTKTLQKFGLETNIIEKIDQYENGKIVQYTDKSGNKVSVIWGYNNALPVVEVLGVEYNVIKPLLAQVDFNNLTLDSFDFLRNQYPNALIKNFTYYSATSKLLTGKKETNEEKVFYQYDSKGNLYRVIDEYNNTLEQYEYNFVN